MNLQLVKDALLAKWRWKLLVGDSWIWRDILIARYEDIYFSSYNGGMAMGLRSSSSWWKKISLIGTKEKGRSDWFFLWYS